MSYFSFISNTAYYTTAFATISTVIPVLTYQGLKLSDSLFDTSYSSDINHFIDKSIFSRERLHIDSPVKNISNIFYNNTAIYYDLDEPDADRSNIVKTNIYNIFQNFEKDSVIKYVSYVNALNALLKEDDFFTHQLPQFNFLSDRSMLFSAFTDAASKVLHINEGQIYQYAQGFSMFGSNFITYRYKFIEEVKVHKQTESFTAHEMIHSAYNIVYGNEWKPFFKDNSTTQEAYQEIFNPLERSYKFSSFLHNSDRNCRLEKEIANHIFKNYVSNVWNAESIAYYAHNAYENPENNCLNEVFSGYKEFIQEHSIPDFIKFIEQHPYCNEIDYSDDVIHCEVIGNNAEVIAE